MRIVLKLTPLIVRNSINFRIYSDFIIKIIHLDVSFDDAKCTKTYTINCKK